MARVLKSSDISARNAYCIGSDDLEEFPDRMPLDWGNTLPDDEPGDYVEEEPLSPEALREAVLQEAREEAERKVKEAYAEGRQRGIESGRQEFTNAVAGCAEALQQAIADMTQARETFLESLEPQILELTTLIARRVISRELKTPEAIIQNTVRKAIAVLSDRQRLIVRLNPEDLEQIRAHEVMLLEEFAGIEQLEVETDDSITRGGCEVHSETMEVNARLEVILDEILSELGG